MKITGEHGSHRCFSRLLVSDFYEMCQHIREVCHQQNGYGLGPRTLLHFLCQTSNLGIRCHPDVIGDDFDIRSSFAAEQEIEEAHHHAPLSLRSICREGFVLYFSLSAQTAASSRTLNIALSGLQS